VESARFLSAPRKEQEGKMSSRYLAGSLLLAVAPVFGGNAAHAVLPVDRNVVYSIRETPSDPQSPVVFTVTLRLVADHRNDNAVAWTVERATFDKLGAESKQWVIEYPALSENTDQFWTIEHADPFNPQTVEFAVPPRLVGTAVAQSSDYDDLNYGFHAVHDTGRIALAQTSASYHFQQVAEPEPEEESEEEAPIVIDDYED